MSKVVEPMGMLSSSMGGRCVVVVDVERLIGERELIRWVVEVDGSGGFVVDCDWDWWGLMRVSREVLRLLLWL